MNSRELANYLARVEGEGSAVCEHEVLDARTARGEAVFLGLRLIAGLQAAEFDAEFGAGPRAFFEPEINSLVEAELLFEDLTSGDLALTRRGRMLADSVFEAFV